MSLRAPTNPPRFPRRSTMRRWHSLRLAKARSSAAANGCPLAPGKTPRAHSRRRRRGVGSSPLQAAPSAVCLCRSSWDSLSAGLRSRAGRDPLVPAPSAQHLGLTEIEEAAAVMSHCHRRRGAPHPGERPLRERGHVRLLTRERAAVRGRVRSLDESSTTMGLSDETQASRQHPCL